MSVKDIIEAEARAAEAAEGGAPVRDLSEVDVKRGRERTEVLQVRLNKEEYEAVKAAAGDLPVSTYARAVLLQAILPTSEAPEQRIEALWRTAITELSKTDIAALRRYLERSTAHRPAEVFDVALLVSRTFAPLEARVEALEKHSA